MAGCAYCKAGTLWGVQAHEPNCVGGLSEEQLRKEVEAYRSGAKEPEQAVLMALKSRVEGAEREVEMWKKFATDGYCPACCYSYNGVLDDLCDNEFCVEHLRDKLIDAGILSRGGKLYGDTD